MRVTEGPLNHVPFMPSIEICGMGRPRKQIDTMGEEPELFRLFNKEKPGWKRERLLAIKRALEEVPRQVVADDLGRSQATIQSWINKFRKGGISELLTKSKGNGPQSRLTPEMEEAMCDAYNMETPNSK